MDDRKSTGRGEFDGGVAIGHSQGEPSRSSMLRDIALSRGYAVIYSSGTRTNTHYNLHRGAMRLSFCITIVRGNQIGDPMSEYCEYIEEIHEVVDQ